MTEEPGRQALDKAWQAWRDAEKAYRDQPSKHIVMWWEFDDPSAFTAPQPVDHEALERLTRLREAAQRAQDAYHEAARNL